MKKVMTLILTTMVLFCFALPVFAEDLPNQGVEGDVIQVLEPEKLEIHLGKEFANQGFKLKLDYGEFPNTVYADENGVLQLEVGGSSEYIITRVDETKPNEPEVTGFSGVIADATANQTTSSQTDNNNKIREGFPIGVIVAVSALLCLGIVSYIATKKTTPKKQKAPKSFDAQKVIDDIKKE